MRLVSSRIEYVKICTNMKQSIHVHAYVYNAIYVPASLDCDMFMYMIIFYSMVLDYSRIEYGNRNL